MSKFMKVYGIEVSNRSIITALLLNKQRDSLLLQVAQNMHLERVCSSSRANRIIPCLYRAGNVETARWLITKSFPVDGGVYLLGNKCRVTCLSQAISKYDYNTIKLLLLAGAKSNTIDRNKMTPVVYAMNTGDMRLLELLIIFGDVRGFMIHKKDYVLMKECKYKYSKYNTRLTNKRYTQMMTDFFECIPENVN